MNLKDKCLSPLWYRTRLTEYYFIVTKGVNLPLNEIGSDFKQARTSAGLNLEEASADTSIPVEALEQIEAGSIGSFKDIFKLKDYLATYSKYLGLNPGEVIDDFNEYMFEYTSKIPLDDLEKKIEEKERQQLEEEKTGNIKVVSPYLRPKEESQVFKYVLIAIVILVLSAAAVIWAIKQVA